jgi:ATP-dependent protease Clp ATPase subunit
LTFSKDAIAQVVQNCISLKTGARGLQSELEKVLMPHMFHSYQYKKQNITKINIDADLVINPKPLIDV